jgi:uncharacterized protein YbjT (DUF2867 family)
MFNLVAPWSKPLVAFICLLLSTVHSSEAFVPSRLKTTVDFRYTPCYSSQRNDRSKETVQNNSNQNGGTIKQQDVIGMRQQRPPPPPNSRGSKKNPLGKITNNSTLPTAKSRSSKDVSKKPKKKTNPVRPTKEELMKAVGETLQKTRFQQPKQTSNLFNPFQAGQKLRQTIDTALALPIPDPQKSQYYLDDRLFVREPRTSLSPSATAAEDFVPEILVVGATGRLGRLLVRQLLLYQPMSKRPKVRVLVRDLYTRTLDILGTGVTYCQGDLRKMETLEDAVTDVDKLVFCARCDDEPELLNNLLAAYQNVRHADYGTSQAAKRSLFKFSGGNRDDVSLFAIEEEEDVTDTSLAASPDSESVEEEHFLSTSSTISPEYSASEDEYYSNAYEGTEDEDYYEDTYGDDYVENEQALDEIETRKNRVLIKTQSRWIRNPFGHGVFVGRIPQRSSSIHVEEGEAAILSSRLRSRDDPELGIALGPSFSGFILRVCSDGSTFEAFVRTGAYYTDGIEYTCEWVTAKKSASINTSRNKFTTVRLPFSSFKPVQRQGRIATSSTTANVVIPPFRGLDVRNIGLRYRTSRNSGQEKRDAKTGIAWNRFYLAISYIKVYRSQPEPEFVYLSDASIPPVVTDDTVHHDRHELVTKLGGSSWGAVPIVLPEDSMNAKNGVLEQSSGEMYSKFQGEELLKRSGLSYAIVRLGELNDSPAGGGIELTATPPRNTEALSRADVARVCVQALLDPEALNKSFYLCRGSSSDDSEDLSAQFEALPTDTIL